MQRYWLSFDLGLRGKYEEMYEWLDNMGAKECGDSVATFRSDKTREQITQELANLLDKNSRVYIISLDRGGKFILGKRKIAPWTGYAERVVESEEEM